MRNLKRALSLTLASVMLLGMMVVGSSAAAGYSDVDENDNVEAIEVLQAVEVMVGDDRGFGPDRPVTRNEMAVVMGKLLNLNYNYYSSTCPFTDVADWAKGWVGACAANGIVSGRGNGIYDGESTVTAIEAASMMMRALGYFKNTEDYADGFQVVTVRQGSQIGIFNNVGTDANTPMTRNQVAQMALNALRSEMVDFTGTPGIEVNGVKVGYRAEYTPRTSTELKYNAIEGRTSDVASDLNHKGQYYIQLGEQLYDGDLKLYDNTTDAFNRPARTWEYDGKEIGTYVKKEQLRQEWTDKVTGKMLYEALTKETVDKYDFLISIDGETEKGVLNYNSNENQYFFTEKNIVRTNTEGVGGTGKGVLTQVFVDTENKDVYIAIINTYFAKAKNDYNAKKDEVELKVYAVEEVNGLDADNNSIKGLVKNASNKTVKGQKTTDIKVLGEDFDIAEVKKDDIFLVNVAENEIQIISDVDRVDGTTINKFKTTDYVATPDAQYDYASAALYDWEVLDNYVQDNMKDTTYNIFLDQYGYLIGLEIVDKPTNYLFLTGVDTSTTNRRSATAEGTVIFLDGTVDEVTIDLDDSQNVKSDGSNWEKNFESICCAVMNTWCTYTVDDNGNYTLIQVANSNTTVNMNEKTQKTPDKLGQSRVGEIDATETTVTTAGTLDTNGPASVTFGGLIDKKHAASMGVTGSTSYKTVYGTEETVYLSASVKDIAAYEAIPGAADGRNALIIDDVDSVATGYQGINLKAYNVLGALNAADVATPDTNGYGDLDDANANTANTARKYVSHGVYNLFDDGGFIIAAVVVGEDEGSSTQYAYVVSDNMNSEAYEHTSKGWTWGRDVIINGAEVTLLQTETKNDTVLDDMDQGCWYEIKYKADGTVKSAAKIGWDDDGNGSADDSDKYVFNADGTTAAKFIGHMKQVEKSITANETVVLSHNLTGATNKTSHYYAINPDDRHADNVAAPGVKSLSHTGNTLQVETGVAGESWDIPVAASAKIVLVQDEQVYRDGVRLTPKVMENITIWDNDGKGAGLDELIDELEKNSNFVGFVSAVFESGPATSVIVWDQTPYKIDAGDNTVVTDNGTAQSGATIDALDQTITVNWTDAQIRKPVSDALKAAGYDVANWNTVSNAQNIVGTESLTATDLKTGVTKTFTLIKGNHFVTIKLNGANKVITENTQFNALFTAAQRDNNLYGKTVKLAGSTVSAGYTATSSTAVLVTDDEVWDNALYLKATMDSTTDLDSADGVAAGADGDKGTTVTYKAANSTVAASADAYVKVNDTIVITVDMDDAVLTAVAAGGKMHAGTVDTDNGYVAAIKTASTLGADAVRETVSNNTVTFSAGTKTYTGGVYTFTKTITQTDIDAKTDLTVPAVAITNS